MNPKVGDLITLKQEYRDPTEEQGVMLILGQEKEWHQTLCVEIPCYKVLTSIRKPINPSPGFSQQQYTLLNQNDIFLVIEYAKVKGRDCYQILHKDEVGWIVDPNPQSIKELSNDTNSR